jgi:CRP-like cAMP-binding protein
MDEEAETTEVSKDISMFAKHLTAPNLLRLAWLPPTKVASFIGIPYDDDIRKIFIYEDFVRDLAVVQSMLIAPRDLLNHFEERIHKPSPLVPKQLDEPDTVPRNSDGHNMEGIAIIEYLKLWVSFDGYHEMANDQVLLRTFNTFCDLHVTPINSSDAKLLKADVKARIKQKLRKEKDKDKKQYYTSAAPKPRDLPKSKNMTLMEIHPEELARQLTLMEEEIFIQIRPREFLKQAWNKGNHEVNAPFVTRLTRNFNKLINWITTEVLKSSDASLRAETIAHFVKTAKYLEQLRNYNGVMQVLSSLHSSAVSRLKQSWALITPKVKGHFDRLTSLMSNLGNFKVFRETYSALEPEEPCIPFIAVFLTDCTYLDDTMNDKDDQARYNWDKLSTMSQKIREIRRFDMRRYDLIPVPSIQHYINSAESWNDNKTLYAISQLAEDGTSNPEGGADSSAPKKTDARKAYSKFNRVTVANMNLKSMYLHQDTTGEQNVLSQRDWKILLTGATLKTYNDGDVVLDIGTTNDRLFRIKTGMVKVHKQSIDTAPVATMGKEEMFGEISMLLRGEDGTTTAAIVAAGEVEIWEISIDFVLRMCEGDHPLSEKLHRIIAVKLASRLKSLNTAKRQRGAGRQASRLIDRRSVVQALSNTPPAVQVSPVSSPKDRSEGSTSGSEDPTSAQTEPAVSGTRHDEKPASSKIRILKTAMPSGSPSSLSRVPEDSTDGAAHDPNTSIPEPTALVKRDSDTPSRSKRRSHRAQSSNESDGPSSESATSTTNNQDSESPPPGHRHHHHNSSSASPLRASAEIRNKQLRSPSPKVAKIQEEDVDAEVATESPITEAKGTKTTTIAESDSVEATEGSSTLLPKSETTPNLQLRSHKKQGSGDDKKSGDEQPPRSPERARATASPDSRRSKRASAQHSTNSIAESLQEAAKEAPRSPSPGKSLSSWRGRVSAALLPRRSTSEGGSKGEKDKEKDKDGSSTPEHKKSKSAASTVEIPEADRQDVLFRKRFKLKEGVILIRTFECALKGTILSHGTLYISEKHWCFGSRMFGLKTSEIVRVETITDVEMTGKYIVIRYGGSKSHKFLGFENIEDTHSFLRSLWEKFTKPASAEPNQASSSLGGSLTRRNSSRFINRSAILFDAATSAASSSSLSVATGSQFSATSSAPSDDAAAADDDEEFGDDISSKFELTPQDWQKILKGANLVAFQKGDFVIREGDQFQRVFQLLRGSACIQKEVDGEVKVLGRLQPEDGIFGEISFLEGGCATASIVADEPETAIYIIEGYFLNVYFERNPGVGGRFFHFLAQLLSKRIKAREAAQAREAAAAAAAAASNAQTTDSPKRTSADASVLMNQGFETDSARASPALSSTTVASSAPSGDAPASTSSGTPPLPSPLDVSEAPKKASSSPHVERQPSASSHSEQPQSSPRDKGSSAVPQISGDRSPRGLDAHATGKSSKSSSHTDLPSVVEAASSTGHDDDRSPRQSSGNSPSNSSSPKTPRKEKHSQQAAGSSPKSRAPLADSLPSSRSPRVKDKERDESVASGIPSLTKSFATSGVSPKSPRSPRALKVSDASPRKSEGSSSPRFTAEDDDLVQLPGTTLLMSGEISPKSPKTSTTTKKASKLKQRSISDASPATSQITSGLKGNNSMSTIPES